MPTGLSVVGKTYDDITAFGSRLRRQRFPWPDEPSASSPVMAQVWELDALGQADLVKRGEATALELVDAAIARVEALNPRINCLAAPMFEEARAKARPCPGVPSHRASP